MDYETLLCREDSLAHSSFFPQFRIRVLRKEKLPRVSAAAISPLRTLKLNTWQESNVAKDLLASTQYPTTLFSVVLRYVDYQSDTTIQGEHFRVSTVNAIYIDQYW